MYILLKVKIDRKELDAFIASSPFAGRPLGNDQVRVLGGDDIRWWATSRELLKFEWKQGQEAFLSGETSLPGADGLRILIDTRDPDELIMYLEFIDA